MKYNVEKNKHMIVINALDDENKIIGELTCTLTNNNTEIYVLKLSVNKEYRRKGISKEMFYKLFMLVRNPEYATFDKISLNVLPEDLCDFNWLVEYYKELGFQPQYIVKDVNYYMVKNI